MITFVLSPQNLFASVKNEIIIKLRNINNIEFDFTQSTNKAVEVGSCYLAFPKKLKCIYRDNKNKELIINNNSLAITQKRYDKTYYYPISKSPFLNLLRKDELIKIIKEANLEELDNLIYLTYIGTDDQVFTIIFDNINFELQGWEMLDVFNNNIVFRIKIKSLNSNLDKELFKIPKLN